MRLYLAVLLLLPCLWAGLGERHWPLIFLRYLPSVVFLIPLVFLTRQRGRAVFGLFVFLVLYSGLALHWPQKGELKVMSWNVHAGVDDLEQVRAYIQSQQPDIVLLQEARIPVRGGPDPVPTLSAGYKVVRGGDLAILSRFPILDQGELPLLSWRPGLWAELQLPNRRLRVINVHYGVGDPGQHLGRNQHGFRAYLRRTAEVRREQTLKLQLPGEVLLGGDFNSPPGSFTQRYLAQRLYDAHETAGLGFGLTYPAKAPVWRIDYLFSTLTPTSCQAPDARGSDHRPVLASFRL